MEFRPQQKTHLADLNLDDVKLPSTHELIGGLWEKYPSICRMFFPKRWAMPPQYPNPENILLHIVSQLVASQHLGTQLRDDPCLTAWALSAGAFAEYGKRVYALESPIGQSLLKTTPKGFTFAAAKPPLPSFLVMLPQGLLTTGSDGDCLGILISMEAEAFAVCAMLQSGAAYTFISPTNDEALAHNLGEEAEGIKYQRAAATLLGESYEGAVPDARVAPDDQANLRRIAYLALNIVAFLSNPSPDINDSILDRPAKKAKSKKAKAKGHDRDFYTPYVIGRRYSHGVRQGHGPSVHRGSVSMHWRAGHWRQQRHGKGRKLVKLIHIEPVLVGSKSKGEDNS